MLGLSWIVSRKRIFLRVAGPGFSGKIAEILSSWGIGDLDCLRIRDFGV